MVVHDIPAPPMPLEGAVVDDAAPVDARDGLCDALAAASGPVVPVSNEVGPGITPLTSAARRFADELGRPHQMVAALCSKVSPMVAGIGTPVKRGGA